MRISPFAIALVVAGATLILAVPEGSAFQWCSAYLDNGPDGCGGYALCVGYSDSSQGFQCQNGVPDPNPCDQMTCAGP